MTTRDRTRRPTSTARRYATGSTRRAAASPARAGSLSLPERLYAAREAKGVDLYRAERDTKIRARYLGALERGDYKELPGAVYTKGFLRNYALYLGLDADEILEQWRRERGAPRESAPVPMAPRPLAAPRKGLTFSPFIVVLALMTVGVLVFAAYLGVQLLRFAKPPTIAVTQPPNAVAEVDDATTSYTLRGTTLAGATVNIASPGRGSVQRDGRFDRGVAGGGGPAARPQRVRRQRPRPGHGQALGGERPHLHHRAVPGDRDADAQRRPARRGRVIRERGDPGAGTDVELELGRDERRVHGPGWTGPSTGDKATPPPPRRHPSPDGQGRR